MKTRDKVAIGLAAGLGVLWGTKALLRHRRRIDLRDRVVVVTGADSGFGLILARQIAARGAVLVLAARKPDLLESAAEEVRAEGAREVLAVPTDVSDEAQARNLIDLTVERFGRIDVLINNAGVILVGPLPSLTVDDYRELMATNFWGAVYTSQAALPHMRARRFGRIANVSSLGGRLAIPHMAPYVASKFALTGYTKALRVEALRDNVHVTGIYPSTIRTGGHTHARFQGDREAEYAWFAFSDTLPGLSSSAETAASRAIAAIEGGDPEVNIGLSTKLAIAFEGLFPDWNSELTALLERTMPAAIDDGGPPVRGEDLRGKVADFANRLIPPRARA